MLSASSSLPEPAQCAPDKPLSPLFRQKKEESRLLHALDLNGPHLILSAKPNEPLSSPHSELPLREFPISVALDVEWHFDIGLFPNRDGRAYRGY